MKRYAIMLLLILLCLETVVIAREDRVMKIRITNRRAIAENEFHTRFSVNWTYIKLPEKTNITLSNFSKNTGKPCDKLNIFVQDGDSIDHPIFLPEKIRNRLLRYLNNGYEKRPFVCLDFIQFLMDAPYTQSCFYEQDYTMKDFNSVEDLNPGQFVVIWANYGNERNRRPVHFALYLGHSLFLWKSGAKSGLQVSDLPAMEKAFMGNHTQILTRKKRLS